METLHNGYTLSDDSEAFDLACAYHWISAESYWGSGLPRDAFEKAVACSLTVGAYAPAGEMVGMARIVTDRATFGWVCDVFVDVAHRQAGLGKAIMGFIAEHPDLQEVRGLYLATRDAQGLYAKFGFGPLSGADRWMEARRSDRLLPRAASAALP